MKASWVAAGKAMVSSIVSILIPCFNAERWVKQAIRSALAQTWPATEVIVIDDGSTDGSLEIIKSFGEQIRWETGPNRGGNNARNRLLELAKGDWLQYLDADDYLLPRKIERQMTCLTSQSCAEVSYSPVLLEFGVQNGSRPISSPYPINTDDLWIGLVRWHSPQTGAYIFARSALIDVGGWNPAQACCQDNELYLRLLMAGKKFVFHPEAGAVYRLWGHESLSSGNPRLVRECRLEIIQKAEKFLRSTKQLTPGREWAINQARFEQARMAWLDNPEAAFSIMRTIHESYPGFVPGEPLTTRYRMLYRVFGFRIAEMIASGRRSWMAALSKRKVSRLDG